MDERDEIFRELCDDAFDLIQRVSLEGRFLYVNRAWLAALGYCLDEVPGLRLLDIFQPDSRSQIEQVCGRLLAGEASLSLAVKLRGKDGREFLATGIVGCQRRSGRPVATYGIFRDVGRSPQAEEELDRLFNLSLDLLCIAGVDGYFKQVNPAFVVVLGYTQEELLSRSFLDFVHPEDREGTLREVQRLAQGIPTVDFRNRYRAKDGSYRWLAWQSAPWAEQGLIYAVARDITVQKHNEEVMSRQAEELARSNAALEQFACVASHDLRAPLRGVANLVDWIAEDMPEKLPEKVLDHLEKLQQMVRHMERLTDEVLRYARVGQQQDDVSLVDTGSLLKDLSLLLAPAEGFRITWQPGMPVFETVRSPLEQVFRNLLSNAMKHHDRRDGKVEVGVRKRSLFYEFSVADDGPGIPPGSHESIFDMFHKLGSGGQYEGTGIGLAMVKRIVESRGGRVWVESEEGGGATFRFTWPRQIPPAEESHAGHSDH